MSFLLKSRVLQTTTSTGTGDLTLIDPDTGYRDLVDAVGSGNSTAIVIDDGNGNWEEVIVTAASGPPKKISRGTVLSNSLGTTAKIDFGAGIKTISISPLAVLLPYFASAPLYADDQILQRKGGAWTVRTPAQVAADLQALFTAITSSGLIDISASGAGQIKFPATQNASSNANTLDDYEEGTFTPAITLGGGATGVTYSTQSGSYTKIGNRVFFNFYLALSSKGSSTGGLAFTGLPFTSTNTFQKSVSTTAFTLLSSLAAPPTSVVNANATTLAVLNWASGSSSSLTNSQITDTSTFEVSGHYDA